MAVISKQIAKIFLNHVDGEDVIGAYKFVSECLIIVAHLAPHRRHILLRCKSFVPFTIPQPLILLVGANQP